MSRGISFVFAVWFFALPCTASQLLVSSAGAPDTALSGSTVAEPRTPSGAMFSNPAGLGVFDRATVDTSIAFSFAKTRVDAAAPSTYDEANSVTVLSPGIGIAVPKGDSWRLGFALYGSVGNKFDFDADPTAGVENRFFSEAGIFTFGAGFAYQVNDRLSVGAAITPLFGLSRMRYTLGETRFKYKLTGPGVQGMLGLRWEPCDGFAVGLGVRTPGKVWMDGRMRLGEGHQDVDLELRMPTQVFAGVSKDFGDRVKASLAVRWTDSSSFGDSMIEFEVTDAADVPFVPRAKDEWLVSAGVEYACSEILTLRIGAGHSNAIVGEKGVSPLVFDTEDTRVGAGFSLNFEHWSVDFMAGHAFRGSRKIAADEALILPGRYSVRGQIAMIGVTWRH
jgi:long-subunit fatty acid transport protein